MAARALDKKYLKMTSEPLVKIQNYFTEIFLIMPYAKIALMVLLRPTRWPPELYIRSILKRHPEPLVQIQNSFTEMVFIMTSAKIAQMVLLRQTRWLPELWTRNI